MSNLSQNLIDDFAYRLSDACRNIENLFERGFDLSIAGFGVGIWGNVELALPRLGEIFKFYI